MSHLDSRNLPRAGGLTYSRSDANGGFSAVAICGPIGPDVAIAAIGAATQPISEKHVVSAYEDSYQAVVAVCEVAKKTVEAEVVESFRRRACEAIVTASHGQRRIDPSPFPVGARLAASEAAVLSLTTRVVNSDATIAALTAQNQLLAQSNQNLMAHFTAMGPSSHKRQRLLGD